MKKGYDPLRQVNLQHLEQEVYSFTKQLCKNRSREAAGFRKEISGADPNQSNASLDRWYDGKYKPMRKRVQNHPATNVPDE